MCFKIYGRGKINSSKCFASSTTHFQLISFTVQLKLCGLISRTTLLTISKSFVIYVDSCQKDKDVSVFKVVTF